MNRDRAAQYQSAYLSDYGFESVMVHYRRELLLERLDKVRPKVVVEIGCGSELLCDAWLQRGGNVECWIIVEPAQQFAEIARNSNSPNLYIVEDFFEHAVPEVRRSLPSPPDLVICSGLLHEVPSATELIDAIQTIMSASTILHANVPNSESLHRRLAKASGIIDNTKVMSDRNINLLQNRVYDIQSLKDDLTSIGLTVIKEGGYLIKPFTHNQMDTIAPFIGDQVLDGLFQLGKEIPALASEIFVEARRMSRE